MKYVLWISCVFLFYCNNLNLKRDNPYDPSNSQNSSSSNSSGPTTITGAVASDLLSWNQVSTTAPWDNRTRDIVATVFNGQIIVAGRITGVTNAGIWKSTDGLNWNFTDVSSSADFYTPTCAAVLGANLYIITSKYVSGSYVSQVYQSSDATNFTLIQSSAAFGYRQSYGCTVFGSKIWIIGGYDGNTNAIYSDVYESADGITWTKTTSTIGDAIYHTTATSNGSEILVIGGLKAGSGSGITSVYKSTDGSVWTKYSSALPEGRTSTTAVYFGSQYWLLGGKDYDYSYEVIPGILFSSDGTSWSYNQTAPWESTAENRWGIVSVVYNNQIWILDYVSTDIAIWAASLK